MTQVYLVTGGAGFIGGNFVLGLMSQGNTRVINLDALTYAGNMDTLAPVMDNPNHIFVQGSILDRTLVNSLLEKHQPSAIINFAAESHVDRSIDSPGEFIQTNVVGTFELLEAFRSYYTAVAEKDRAALRFLHVSTDEVYGSLGTEGFFTEQTPYAPNSPYSASKAGADHLVRAYHHTYGLPTLTTNCSNNYGPFQFPEKLIPLIIQKALTGEKLPFMETACRCATGCMWKTTATPSRKFWRLGKWEKSITSAGTTKWPTSMLSKPFAGCSTQWFRTPHINHTPI